MLTRAENELLTRVGPGTPLGEMMRRYWHPIALSRQVVADGAPLRTKLLGQRFVVFRDTDGRAGVLNEMCMHRGVSLALGRNEEGGLRCLYHGWKFAVDGTVLETPNHADCRFRERLKAPTYPVQEQSGIIWAYIGLKELEPPFRSFEFDIVPETNRVVSRANTKACWLSLWEGGLDTSHVGMLHTNLARPAWVADAKARANGEPPPAPSTLPSFDVSPTYAIEDTDFGFQYAAFRQIGESEQHQVRLVPAMMPYSRIIATPARSAFVMEVPMDDFETATFLVSYSKDHPMDEATVFQGLGYDSPLYNQETCDFDLTWANGLGQNRGLMDTNWTGYSGIELEDFAMSVSIAEDWDRTKEHLSPSDIAVVRMRRTVLEAIRRHQEGIAPPSIDRADMTKIIGYDRVLRKDSNWQSFAPDNRPLVAAE